MENKQCRFCNFIQKEEPCYKIFENDLVFALMDKYPVNTGHVLVMPKKHVVDFEDIDDEIYTKLMLATKKISEIIKKITKCKKIGLLVAGFDIPHAHIHIIPLYKKGEVCTKRTVESKYIEASAAELLEVSEKIMDELNK